MIRRIGATVMVSLVTLTACSSDKTADTPGGASGAGGSSGAGGGNPQDGGKIFSKLIGPEGGLLEAVGENMSLWIPPGEVGTPTTFTIEVKDAAGYAKSGELLSPVYVLGPDGYKFGRGATLTMAARTRPPVGEAAVVAVLDPTLNDWVALDRSHEVGDVASGQARVVGKTEHFSAFTTFHGINQFDEKCRTLLSANALGINQADTLNVSGSTVVSRQKAGQIEYGSMWTINTPTVTVSGVGMVDGPGKWAGWTLGQPTSGRPKPVPTGFPIVGNKFSFTIDVKASVATGIVAFSIDDFCPGDYDLGFTCAAGCMGTAVPDAGVPTDAATAADVVQEPRGPVACQVGSTPVASASPRKFTVAGTTLLGADDLGTVDAFSTWSLATPTAPVRSDTLTLTASDRRQIAVSGTTAFVTDGTRIVAINIADPANITEVGSYNLNNDAVLKAALGNPVNGVKAYGIAVSGNYAYVAASDRGFVVVDISNPAAMARVGHAIDGSVGAGDVVISGTKAFVTSQENSICIPGPCVPANVRGFLAYDITTPATPTRLVHFSVPGTNPTSISISGNNLYLTSSSGRFYVIDITTIAAPVVGLATDTNGFAYSSAIAGGKLYVASNSTEAHLQVYSLANPAMPARLTDEKVADTGGAYGVAVSATHAYVASIGKVSVIDLQCP